MALKRDTRYPGRFVAANTAHPQGAFKNRSTPTAQDGSYLEADWANDWDGFFARILNVAGVAPNGTVDTGTASQLYDALLNAMPGRLNGTPQVITGNTTFTPRAGTKNIMIEAVSGGGGGGSVINISAGQSAIAGGGFSGEYVRTPLLTPQSLMVVVGTAGTGGTGGGAGNPGTGTSVGSIISLRGGPGGGGGSASTSNVVSTTSGAITGTLNYPANSIYYANSLGPRGMIINAGVLAGALAGSGGSSPFGTGAPGTNVSSAGSDATGFGAGGSGAINIAANPSRNGGNGSPGAVVIWEFS